MCTERKATGLFVLTSFLCNNDFVDPLLKTVYTHISWLKYSQMIMISTGYQFHIIKEISLMDWLDIKSCAIYILKE